VIGGQHEEDRVRRARLRMQRGDGDRGRGIAPDRLEHDVARRHARLAQLLGDQKAVLVVAHHERRADAFDAREAQRGLLDHGALAGERQELFRIERARQRPQARSRAAAQDDWLYLGVSAQPLRSVDMPVPAWRRGLKLKDAVT